MPRPTYINLVSFFYPTGNTPAVCLTQDIPPEQDADILLLGCGDIRNILFTAYTDTAPSTRRLDITCCDIEEAIIARNILAFTLLLDDTAGNRQTSIWQIYYHINLDATALKLLQAQAKKLLDLAVTLDSWKAGKYGKTLIFCDEGTFNIVKKLWEQYATSNRTKNEQVKCDAKFKAGIEDSIGQKKDLGGDRDVLTGLRSAAPASADAIPDVPKAHEHFWKYGTTDRAQLKAKDRRCNPTFASQDTDTFTLHYGTDPHLGFPLATAYVPLTKESPLRNEDKSRNDFHRITDAARTHFRAWCGAFRKSAKNFTLRFFVGDAIAFGHTLQHMSNWYRNKYTVQTIDLNADDYGSSGTSPVTFDVIDTSNLLDHLGPVNVLVAACPLLKRKVSSTFYTESLVAREKNRKDLMDRLLCGSFPTMSLLLGLMPIEYWTNATAVSSTAETILDASAMLSNTQDGSTSGQMHCRIVWKTSLPSLNSDEILEQKLHIDPKDLAILAHRTYRSMFEHEDMMKAISSIKIQTIHNNSCHMYHRGSFATFLNFLQTRVVTDWDKMMEMLIERISNDRSIMMGLNFIQELFVYLSVLDIYKVPGFQAGCTPADAARFKQGLGSWKVLPPVVCITLEVPRTKLQVFKDIPRNQLGTPNVQCRVEKDSSMPSINRWQEIFADVQLSFGTLTKVGEVTSDDFKSLVQEDPLGWAGNSPLLVSFNVPTWVILREPATTAVKFGIQSTPQSAMTFSGHLGVTMTVFGTKLMDKNVHITKFRPHQAGHASIAKHTSDFRTNDPDGDVKTTITMNIEPRAACMSGLTGRLDLVSSEVKALLLAGASVKLSQISPSIVSIILGDNGRSFNLNFSIPVLANQSKTRIARKSAYIEVDVPTADHVSGRGFPNFMFPVGLRSGVPVLSNMPYLNLECLSVIDIGSKTKSIDWLNSHSAFQMSARERVQRDQSIMPEFRVVTDVRTKFKESLHSIFMLYSGVQGKRANTFSLCGRGGVGIIIFVSRMLLDIANHTVVLDCAILPLTFEIMLEFGLSPQTPYTPATCNIEVDREEIKLWKEILPAMIERCRDWKHNSTCEYIAASKIPLSTEADGAPPVCSCGNGKFPDKFIPGVSSWASLSKYATRAAISPTFPVAYVERTLEIQDITTVSMIVCRNLKCGKEKGVGGAALSKCSRCLKVWYCSSQCQRADWKEHKKVCRAPE